MKTTILLCVALLCGSDLASAAEMRCGWLRNPTPANWWLEDSDGSWTIMTQGGNDEPQGMDMIPDISEHDYVATNGNYGYACACMRVETNDDRHIMRIRSFTQMKLAKCEMDRKLPKP